MVIEKKINKYNKKWKIRFGITNERVVVIQRIWMNEKKQVNKPETYQTLPSDMLRYIIFLLSCVRLQWKSTHSLAFLLCKFYMCI